jgi:hypothetical protein
MAAVRLRLTGEESIAELWCREGIPPEPLLPPFAHAIFAFADCAGTVSYWPTDPGDGSAYERWGKLVRACLVRRVASIQLDVYSPTYNVESRALDPIRHRGNWYRHSD